MNETVKCSSDIRYKQEAIIEFLVCENSTPIAFHCRLKAFFGDDAFDVSTVRYWVRQVKDNSMVLHDKSRSERLKVVQNDRMRARVDKKISENRRITQRQLANELGISQASVNAIISDLQYRQICAKWVPKFLTNEMKVNQKKKV